MNPFINRRYKGINIGYKNLQILKLDRARGFTLVRCFGFLASFARIFKTLSGTDRAKQLNT